ncbi:maltose alpha-D-glucosyltransferase [Candidatus Methylospira mobilis]|uniref:maltose alpha-D-glucosyltransferase n=1 Tax=Candidatus Methylospira mobilis TaxID=1808979 RepID=A0A5Q0BIX7_9GAMM|nr:maltose alpha-D-glucosyltransferase [Candidatus Methylospira mobilis]QFY43519.1 maltose alpha-D-glucosyltransferase [Candidatus Methylospira mobilis]
MSDTQSGELKKTPVDNESWMNNPLWYKDAVIYELHVKAFFDSDNNGVGDFAGLIQKLDYLQDLGVNTLWLLPFYPSPMRDDGYDIADYRMVHPEYGDMADFRQFVKDAHRRSLKVITELVINHTSDRHPWFQAARRAPAGSSKRNFYIWSDSDRKFPETRVIFTDTEKSNWAWDEEAHAYYWHRFFSHQPDLNYNNPQVVKAVIRLMRFWLDRGVDGVRLDAIPYLCVREGTQNENLPETHGVIKQMRAVLDKHYRNRVFLAEVNQWPEDVSDYFSDGDECHMAYHFPLMPRMYMAIAQEDRHPIVDIIRQTPDIPETCQWAIFLRNHDELTLEMVTDKERDYMYQMYAGDPRARLNIGIRRRLAPLMDNEINKIRLMNSLLFSMLGSPIIYYGDEIGMGDNFFLGDRNGVRTPMQWSPDRNAGFSRADPQRLYLPPIMDPVYGYGAVNVEAQLRERASLLNWMRRVLAVRKNHPAFRRGKLVFLHPGNRKILAYFRVYEDDIILCVGNLSRAAQAVELDLSAYQGCVPVELMGRSVFPPIGELPYLLTLPGHNFYWFQLADSEEVPAWHEEHLPLEELPTLVLFDGWRSFFRDRVEPWRVAMAERVRGQLEKDALPRFVVAQRWLDGRGEPVRCVTIGDNAEWRYEDCQWLLALVGVEGATGEKPPSYFLPLALAWENGDPERLHAMSANTVAKVRRQAQLGILSDAFADQVFCRALVLAIGAGRTLACERGVIRFLPGNAYAGMAGAGAAELPVRTAAMQGNNTTVVLGERLFLKGYRRLQIGTQPEFDIGRFLTDVAKFPNIAPLAGAVEYESGDGGCITLALLQGYVENQGNCWVYTLDYLARFIEECRTEVASPIAAAQAHGAYLVLIRTLGRRTGELHNALGTATGDAAFDPEPVTDNDIADWVRHVQAEAVVTLDLLDRLKNELTETVREVALTLLAQRNLLADHLQNCIGGRQVQAVKTRCHGDYHLGQALLTQNDFVIIDFEGDSARPLSERCRKHSPLKDVASMLLSFSYAAHTAHTHDSAERTEDWTKFEPLLREWEAEAGRVFLVAYDEAVHGSELLAASSSRRGLLDLFLLEKALYAVRYELDNRPDRAFIPLRGILALLQQAVNGGS